MAQNLLLITADQWRGDCLSALDHACVKTPHLDALAGEGVLFSRHYAQAAPCGPSRASLHTGLYLMNHRSVINGSPLDRRHLNWAQVVRSAGYDPLLFGYTDTSADPRDYPPDHPVLTTYEGVLPGITAAVPLTTQDLTTWVDWLRNRGVAVPERLDDLYLKKMDQLEWEEGGPCAAPLLLDRTLHDTYFLTEQVIEHVNADSDPWCIHLSWLRPHPPWIAPVPYNARYAPAALPDFVRASSQQKEALQHPWLAYELGRVGHRPRDLPARLRRLQASYYGLMSEVDDNLGRLIAHLKTIGQYDNTLIIFTSDHGEQMGDHWLLGKCGYFDQSFHIPLIIRDPRPDADVTRGNRVNAFTENVDIMPTLLDWLGLEVPPACDGASLLPFVRGSEIPAHWRDCAHWEFDFRNPADPGAETSLGLPMHACSLSVIRDRHFKYVHFAGLQPLLFDLLEDPAELHNLADDPGYAQVMLEYVQRMLTWRMRHADQTLTHSVLTENGMISRSGKRW